MLTATKGADLNVARELSYKTSGSTGLILESRKHGDLDVITKKKDGEPSSFKKKVDFESAL